jgi:hypothetical protein
MLEEILSLLGQQWLLAVIVLLLGYLAKNYFNHGLNQYPGPVLAGLSDWWRFFDVYGRRPDITHLKLHRQHGDIVRLGPNVLSFSDPKAIKQIYGLNKGFVKVSLNSESKIAPLIVTVWLLSRPNGRFPGQATALAVFDDG